MSKELEAQKRQLEAMRRRIFRDLAQQGIHVEAMTGACVETAIRALIVAKNALKAKPARQGSPARERPGPTPERLRHAGMTSADVPRGKPQAVRLARPLDAVQAVLDAYEREGAEAYFTAWAAMQGRSIVPDYAGARGGGGGRIFAPEAVLNAGQFFREVNARLSPLMRQVAENFILEQPVAGRVRPMTFEELGCLLRGTKDQRVAKAVGHTYLHAACNAIAHAIEEWEATKREIARQRRRA